MIDAVVCPLKSGKEADLFVVESEPFHYVAKVYKERKFRSFKNDAGYREGRSVRSTRGQRALEKRSKYGQKLAEHLALQPKVGGVWDQGGASSISMVSIAGLVRLRALRLMKQAE